MKHISKINNFKQYLYHYTSIYSLIKILYKNNIHIRSKYSDTISLTRNSDLRVPDLRLNKLSCRIAFDKEVLKNKYKLKFENYNFGTCEYEQEERILDNNIIIDIDDIERIDIIRFVDKDLFIKSNCPYAMWSIRYDNYNPRYISNKENIDDSYLEVSKDHNILLKELINKSSDLNLDRLVKVVSKYTSPKYQDRHIINLTM